MQRIGTVVDYLSKHGTWIKYNNDSAYGVCVPWRFLKFTGDLINDLHFNKIMNLTVC